MVQGNTVFILGVSQGTAQGNLVFVSGLGV